MGCGSRAGKMEMHSAGKPQVNSKHCVGCAVCTKICAHAAINLTDKKAKIDHLKCVGCGRCIGMCAFDAINPPFDESFDILNAKMAEYTMAVLDNKPHFHLSLVIDVSPYCDCHAENDLPIVPDIGMFASFDPVALDRACADACNQAPVIPGSILSENLQAAKLQTETEFDRFAHTTRCCHTSFFFFSDNGGPAGCAGRAFLIEFSGGACALCVAPEAGSSAWFLMSASH